MEKDNKNKMLVKPEWLEVRRTETIEIIVDGIDLLKDIRKSKVKDIRKSKVKDDEVIKAMKEMKRAGVKMLRDEK